MKPVEFEVTVTPRHVLAANSRGTLQMIVLLIVVFGAVLVVLSQLHIGPRQGRWFTPVVFGLIPVLIVLWGRWRLLRNIRRMGFPRTSRFRVADDGIRITGPNQSIKLTWDQVLGVRRKGRLFLLVVGPRQWFILPADQVERRLVELIDAQANRGGTPTE